jgi:cytochrome c oxidase subunit II
VNILDASGPGAARIADLIWIFTAVSVVVYVLVLAATWWAVRRQRRPEDLTEVTDVSLTRTVGAATAVTALILVALLGASVLAGRGLTGSGGPSPIEVDVIGRQWWWDFQYRDPTPSQWVNSPNELHVPVGTRVLLRLQSRDVIHSFWVPRLQGKRDLVPGIVNEMWIEASEAGIYRGVCAEFCGHQHAHMQFVVVAEPMDDFQRWLVAQRQPAREPETAQESRGRDVVLGTTCVMCHTVRGTTAGSRVGPDLTHVGGRRTLAAGTLANSSEHLARWIRDAQSIKPGSRMPSHDLSRADLAAVAAYLRSLR